MIVVRTLFPFPWLSLTLWAIWLLVNNTFSPGHMVLGGILAILIPFATAAFWPEPVRLRRPWLAIKYCGRLALDILTANLQVAVWIIRPNRRLQPAFIRYELELHSPLAISLLASTISLTPGTVSCDLSSDQRFLLIHCLHVEDADSLALQIHERYEQPLLEVLKSC
ncbi:MAG: multicomponent K+:H+ antiporter subunit E [Verrucomicrobiales bacterium]|jgi:multicomponent K+:H+ antiporter subunit E